MSENERSRNYKQFKGLISGVNGLAAGVSQGSVRGQLGGVWVS